MAAWGSYAQMWECNGGRHQDWQYVRRADIGQGSNVYQIKSRRDGRCLSAIHGTNFTRTVNVEQCNDGYLDHFWIKIDQATDYARWALRHAREIGHPLDQARAQAIPQRCGG
jgi:hypothetical protein